LILWFILLAGAAAVLISPLRIWVDYRHRGKTEDSLLVQISYLWGLGNINIQVPVITTSSKGVTLQASVKKKKRLRIPMPRLFQLMHLLKLHDFLQAMRKFLRFLGRGINIRTLVWQTEIGFADSATLAQSIGVLWAVKGMVCAALARMLRFSKPPVFRVFPYFNRSFFRAVFSCILEISLGYAIIAAFFFIYLVLKLKLSKRGDKNVGTSNSRSDEDGDGKHQGNGRCQYGNR